MWFKCFQCIGFETCGACRMAVQHKHPLFASSDDGLGPSASVAACGDNAPTDVPGSRDGRSGSTDGVPILESVWNHRLHPVKLSGSLGTSKEEVLAGLRTVASSTMRTDASSAVSAPPSKRTCRPKLAVDAHWSPQSLAGNDREASCLSAPSGAASRARPSTQRGRLHPASTWQLDPAPPKAEHSAEMVGRYSGADLLDCEYASMTIAASVLCGFLACQEAKPQPQPSPSASSSASSVHDAASPMDASTTAPFSVTNGTGDGGALAISAAALPAAAISTAGTMPGGSFRDSSGSGAAALSPQGGGALLTPFPSQPPSSSFSSLFSCRRAALPYSLDHSYTPAELSKVPLQAATQPGAHGERPNADAVQRLAHFYGAAPVKGLSAQSEAWRRLQLVSEVPAGAPAGLAPPKECEPLAQIPAIVQSHGNPSSPHSTLPPLRG